jgi:lipid-A-disaccharide synthase
MRPFVDHVLAVLPFEPKVMERLGGPPCSYVGHPLLELRAELRPSPQEALARAKEPPLVLVLPGSRRLEIRRLGSIFGEAIGFVAAAYGRIDFVLPTLPALAPEIAVAVESWPVKPRIVTTEAEKYAAFRRARAALAASGTVTLELALAQVPMVAAYKVPLFEEAIARAVAQVKTPILVDLALGENVTPVFLQRDCTAAKLAAALLPLLGEDAARRRQLDAFARLERLFATGEPPSAGAARIAIETFEKKTGRRAPQA